MKSEKEIKLMIKDLEEIIIKNKNLKMEDDNDEKLRMINLLNVVLSDEPYQNLSDKYIDIRKEIEFKPIVNVDALTKNSTLDELFDPNKVIKSNPIMVGENFKNKRIIPNVPIEETEQLNEGIERSTKKNFLSRIFKSKPIPPSSRIMKEGKEIKPPK